MGCASTAVQYVQRLDHRLYNPALYSQLLMLVNFFQLLKNEVWQLQIGISDNGILLEYALNLINFLSPLHLLEKFNLEIFTRLLCYSRASASVLSSLPQSTTAGRSRRRRKTDEGYLKRTQRLLRLWNMALPFVLLDSLLELLTSPFSCSRAHIITGFLVKDSINNYCSSVPRYILMGAAGVALVLLVVMAVLNAWLFVDDTYNTHNALAHSSNSTNTLMLIYKMTACLLPVLSSYDTLSGNHQFCSFSTCACYELIN